MSEGTRKSRGGKRESTPKPPAPPPGDIDVELADDKEFKLTVNIAEFYVDLSVGPVEKDAATNSVRRGSVVLKAGEWTDTSGCAPSDNPCVHYRSF